MDNNFYEDIRSFRVGSPVIVDGKITWIQRIHKNADSKIIEIKVFGSADNRSYDSLCPIHIDEGVLRAYSAINNKKVWEERGNNHKVSWSVHDFSYSLDGNYQGEVKYLHEWKNIVEDCTGVVLHRYYGKNQLNNSDDENE